MTRPRRLILVTGTPRSGTTPVGDALAAAPATRTLYEPLNFHVGDRRVGAYFEVPGGRGLPDDAADDRIADIARLRLRLRPGLFPEDHGWRRVVKRVTGSRTAATYRMARLDPGVRTLVWKDPFAAFYARRAAAQGVPVVATFRPAPAVAASFKRLGWRFDVAALVERLGTPPAAARAVAALDLARPATNAAALWFVVNDWLLDAARDPGIRLLDMDAFVADPSGVLRALYADLGLRWSAATERHLRRSTRGEGPATPLGDRAHGGRRDPTAVNRYWVDVLDEAEARQIAAVTGDLEQRLRSAAAAVSAHTRPPQP